MKSNSKKKVVITGGTRGIGKSIADAFHKNGCDVLVTGTKIKEENSDFLYKVADFTLLSEIETFSGFLKKHSPDILINNAGINIISNFEEISLKDFLTIQQVNVIAPFRFCQSVIPAMKERGWGRIVNIASIWSKISKSGRASYSTSKFGLDGMTTAIAAELSKNNILINCVSPGFIETDLTKQTLGEEGIKQIVDTIPMKRLGQSNEIAELVVWLCGEKNTYLTGQNIAIDGGFTRV